MRVLLDTSVLIAGRFGLDDSHDLAVTSLSYGELNFGASLPGLTAAERSRRLKRILALQQLFGPGLPFDDAAAASYGIITEFVVRSGRSVRGRAVDLLIAAVAHSRDAAVVTLNPNDFRPLGEIMDILSP
jgi:predicted nucleic acid-binding protein